MLNNILFIGIALLLLVVVVFAVGFIELMLKFKEIEEEYETLRDSVVDAQNVVMNVLEREVDAQNVVMNVLERESELINMFQKSLDMIEERNKIDYATVEDIKNNYDKLLKCWSDVDDRFEASTEQFRHVADQLFAFKKVLEPWCIDADNLGENIVNMSKVIVNPIEPMINDSDNAPKKKTTRKKKDAEIINAEEN
mgnify:CR=1 FL=1